MVTLYLKHMIHIMFFLRISSGENQAPHIKINTCEAQAKNLTIRYF